MLQPWKIIRQPNRRYARFSSRTNCITHVEMAREHAIKVIRNEGLRYTDAEQMLAEADASPTAWTEALALIERINGVEAKKQVLEQIRRAMKAR